jgi:hypothetical protein
MDIDKKKKYRIYRLHQKIKGVYRFDIKEKTIYVPDLEKVTNKYIIELSEKFNYSIQFEIPS